MRRRWMGCLAMLSGLLLATSAEAQFTGGTGGGGTGGTTIGSAGGLGGTSFTGSRGSTIGGSGGLGGGLGGGTGGGLGGGTGGTGGNGLGGTSLTGGGLLGQGSMTGSQTTNTNAVGGTSFLGRNYAYPLAKGLPTHSLVGNTQASATVAFGQPLYTVSGATGTTGQGGAGGLGGGNRLGGGGATTAGGFGGNNFGGGLGGGGTATTATGQGSYASSAGMDRVIPYVTTLGFQPNLPSQTVVGQQVQTMFGNSTRLSTGSSVQVVRQQDGFVLQGQAGSARERAVMEAMARLTPGVRAVRNDIQVVPGR